MGAPTRAIEQEEEMELAAPKYVAPEGVSRAVPFSGEKGCPRDARARAYTLPGWQPTPQPGADTKPQRPERESATEPKCSFTPELGSGWRMRDVRVH